MMVQEMQQGKGIAATGNRNTQLAGLAKSLQKVFNCRFRTNVAHATVR